MKELFNGKKSIIGAIIAGAGAVLAYLGYIEQAKLVASLGGTLFGIGIAHKMQKGNDSK
jgi:hypothetical protein